MQTKPRNQSRRANQTPFPPSLKVARRGKGSPVQNKHLDKSIYSDRSVRNKSRRANQTPSPQASGRIPSRRTERCEIKTDVQNKHLNKSMYSDRSVRNKSRRPNQTPSPQASKLQGETRGRPCRREARHQALPTTLPPRLLNFEYRGTGSELAGRTVHRLFFRTYR